MCVVLNKSVDFRFVFVSAYVPSYSSGMDAFKVLVTLLLILKAKSPIERDLGTNPSDIVYTTPTGSTNRNHITHKHVPIRFDRDQVRKYLEPQKTHEEMILANAIDQRYRYIEAMIRANLRDQFQKDDELERAHTMVVLHNLKKMKASLRELDAIPGTEAQDIK